MALPKGKEIREQKQLMRIRITFAKTSAMRYTGHLDLHRAWERAFRRAGLPLAYTQGYNPHPRLNLGSALPLGFTGEAEVIDAWLEQDLPVTEIQAALQSALPPGLQVSKIEPIDSGLPSLQTQLEASDYQVTFLAPFPDLAERVQALMATESLMRQRRERCYDLRPLVLELKVLEPDEQGCPRLAARLAARDGATGRPEEVIEALGSDPLLARIQRIRLVFRDTE